MPEAGHPDGERLWLHLLVLCCQFGDECAFTRLFDRFGGKTLGYLRGLVGDHPGSFRPRGTGRSIRGARPGCWTRPRRSSRRRVWQPTQPTSSRRMASLAEIQARLAALEGMLARAEG